MNTELLVVPYDSGVRGVRMGAGPTHLVDAGLDTHIGTKGRRVSVRTVTAPHTDVPAEIATAFGLNAVLAGHVERAVAGGWFPVVLSGSCYTAVGTLAGLTARRPGVLWFDTHADFNTPETSRSGFLDGMALAMVTGRCWRQLTHTVPGFEPVPEESVMLLGARHIDDLEAESLTASRIRCLSCDGVRSGLVPALTDLNELTTDVYLHIDLDVLDPAEARANALAAPDGLTVSELTTAVTHICRTLRVRAIALTAYDPTVDPDGNVYRAVCDVLDAVFGHSDVNLQRSEKLSRASGVHRHAEPRRGPVPRSKVRGPREPPPTSKPDTVRRRSV